MFRNSRVYLAASILGIVLFTINLVVGKMEVSSLMPTSMHLDGVPEFLLLLTAIIFFVISTLLKERAETNDTQ